MGEDPNDPPAPEPPSPDLPKAWQGPRDPGWEPSQRASDAPQNDGCLEAGIKIAGVIVVVVLLLFGTCLVIVASH